MSNWLKIPANRTFLLLLLLLIAVNVFATLTQNMLLLKWSKPFFIPIFLVYYFSKNGFVGTFFWIFVLLSFFADSTSVFVENSVYLKTSSIIYGASYACLVFMVMQKLRSIHLDKVVGLYLVVVFLINIFFMVKLYDILKFSISDTIELTMFTIRAVALVALALVAFVMYLNEDNKQSIMFLMMALSFVFSDVLYYINNYYIYNWGFVAMERALHVTGLFFLFKYVIEQNRELKKQLVFQRKQEEAPTASLLHNY